MSLSNTAQAAWSTATNTTFVGFGTAALGPECYNVVKLALDAGFRTFDTAEADFWYDQSAVGRALSDYFLESIIETTDCESQPTCDGATGDNNICARQDLQISTKIPPWSLTSFEDIRNHAASSRQELLGFCSDDEVITREKDGMLTSRPSYPLDIYYIHAPACWKGWHPRCDNPPPILALRDAWLAMEAVVGLDYSARRIGLSNVQPYELLDIIHFVKERQAKFNAAKTPHIAPPRMPDVLQAFADPIAPADELRQICQEHGIAFVSYSTLGTQHRQSAGNPVLTNPIILELAQEYERSTAEVVLSWALQKNMSVIPRSRQLAHIHELARLRKEDPQGFLTEQDLARIDSLRNTM